MSHRLVCGNTSPPPSPVNKSAAALIWSVLVCEQPPPLAHQVLIPSYNLWIPIRKLNRKAIPLVANSHGAGFIAILSHRDSIGLVNLILLESFKEGFGGKPCAEGLRLK